MDILEILKIQDSESVKNSYYRSPRVSPHIQKQSDNEIIVKTVENEVIITKVEEVILNIIANFKFSPVWLIQQWTNNAFEKMLSWINVGLVWAETTSMGVFLRPTRFLLDMLKIDDDKYIEIPFGMLNHNCSEQQLLYDIHLGNEGSELWQIIKNEETLPCYHPLGLIVENETGTIALREADFRIGFRRYNTNEIQAREEELIREIRSGKKFTSEFTDFSRFPIVNFNEKGELITQTPDILVPIPRKESKAQSYAIEIELSPKTPDKYKGIMNNYKNNVKFGKLFYLCGSQRIARLIKDAYKAVGGLGDCELFLVPFIPPAMRLDNYTTEDEQGQRELLQETHRSII